MKINRRQFLGTVSRAGILGLNPGLLKAATKQNTDYEKLDTELNKTVLKRKLFPSSIIT